MSDFAFSRRGQAAADQPISYLIAQAVANPDLISLAAGLVDYDTLPIDAVAELASSDETHATHMNTAKISGGTPATRQLRRGRSESA